MTGDRAPVPEQEGAFIVEQATDHDANAYCRNWEIIHFPPEVQQVQIGRIHQCDLRFEENTVSRMHCRIDVVAEGLACQDLGSSNGTYVNGERIGDVTILRHGDRIRFGPDISFIVGKRGDQLCLARLVDESTVSVAAQIELDIIERADTGERQASDVSRSDGGRLRGFLSDLHGSRGSMGQEEGERVELMRDSVQLHRLEYMGIRSEHLPSSYTLSGEDREVQVFRENTGIGRFAGLVRMLEYQGISTIEQIRLFIKEHKLTVDLDRLVSNLGLEDVGDSYDLVPQLKYLLYETVTGRNIGGWFAASERTDAQGNAKSEDRVIVMPVIFRGFTRSALDFVSFYAVIDGMGGNRFGDKAAEGIQRVWEDEVKRLVWCGTFVDRNMGISLSDRAYREIHDQKSEFARQQVGRLLQDTDERGAVAALAIMDHKEGAGFVAHLGDAKGFLFKERGDGSCYVYETEDHVIDIAGQRRITGRFGGAERIFDEIVPEVPMHIREFTFRDVLPTVVLLSDGLWSEGFGPQDLRNVVKETGLQNPREIARSVASAANQAIEKERVAAAAAAAKKSPAAVAAQPYMRDDTSLICA